MKHFLRYILTLFSTGVFVVIQGQVPGTVKKWNIQDCFHYAAEHNIRINTLRLSEETALQDLTAAKGLQVPSLSGNISGILNKQNNNNATENGSLVNQLTNSGTYSVNSSVVLWNDNYINNNIRQQKQVAQSAGLSVQETENDITLSITQAYLNILLAKENERYAIDLVNTIDSSVQQGKLLYDAGSIAKKDFLQLQAQLAGDKYLLVQTQNAIRQNVLELKQILQLPSDTPFDIETPASMETNAALRSLQDVQQTALENFPEVKIGKLGLDIAALDIAKAKAGFKPILKANGAIGSGYYDVITNNINPKSGYLTQTGNNFYQTIGLGLSIPIFSQRINKTNLAKANIAYKQADLNLQNNTLILSQSVEQAYLNAVNAIQAYDAANQQLLAVTESYRIANEQLKLGAITTYDLLVQQNQYIQAVQAFTQAKYSVVLQQKIYEFYMGRPVTL